MSTLTSQVYDYASVANFVLGGAPPMVMRNLKKLGPPKSALDMAELRQVLQHPQHGRVYFAHLLLPHEPYVFDENCDFKPRAQWNTEMQSDARVEREGRLPRADALHAATAGPGVRHLAGDRSRPASRRHRPRRPRLADSRHPP